MKLNTHLHLGEINCLRVDRETPHGLFLTAQDEKDVLLPKVYVQSSMKIDSLVEVFLYTDSEDRLVATTLTPKAMLDQYGVFEVVDTAPFGAFVDWGLPKDLLVPKKLQKNPFRVGEKKFLKVIYDEKTHRLVGSEKLGDFFEKHPKELAPNKEVSILILAETPLGYKTLVNNKYEGLLYRSELFEKLHVGDEKKAYVKTVRKDSKIDLILHKAGTKGGDDAKEKIIKKLEANKGILPFNSKSDPELVKENFSMSKKEFKRTLSALVEENIIEVKETGIYLKE